MKFEVGKWYLNNDYPNYKFLCVNIRGGQTYDFVSYLKEEEKPCLAFSVSVNDETESALYYELKERRAIENKTTWYSAVNFDGKPQKAVHVICGIDAYIIGDSIEDARSEVSELYPSLAKMEITAKVTEIFEDD